MKRALISVSDKTGILDFTKELVKLGYEIISTGGTKKVLEDAGIDVIGISEVTNFPEIMDGRVKTLHPNVHGALLCVRDKEEHLNALADNKIEFIDMVVVNLYPFKNILEKIGATHEELIENIDIGGPSMLRSAAKNYKWITVISDSSDYKKVIEELKKGEIPIDLREYLAGKVFTHTSAYDSMIGNYLLEKNRGKVFEDKITFTYEKVQEMRYGENPHQKAAFYKTPIVGQSLSCGIQLNGKEMSYNNIQDANAALEILKEFNEPAVVAVKHMNPCGVGIGEDIDNAWDKAYFADPVSIFGGIVVANRTITKGIAKKISKIFLEIVIAPDFEDEALEIITQKKNIRVIRLDVEKNQKMKMKITSVMDGVLIQEIDERKINLDDLEFVTEKKPTEKELEELLFAWKVVKHVKSNAIVLAKEKQTIGVGAGQMNRVGAAKIAIEQAGEKAFGSVMASDAFFPMPDTVELAVKNGIKAIIQPGGSIKDQLSIDECNKNGIAMVFTGVRHFKH